MAQPDNRVDVIVEESDLPVIEVAPDAFGKVHSKELGPIIRLTIEKRPDSSNTPVRNWGKIAQVLNKILEIKDADELEKFTTFRNILRNSDFAFIREFAYASIRADGTDTGKFLLANVIMSGDLDQEKAKQYWPAFQLVLNNAIAETWAMEAYRFGGHIHDDVEEGVHSTAKESFGKLADEMCELPMLDAADMPSDELKAILEPYRVSVRERVSGTAIMSGVGASANRSVDFGGSGTGKHVAGDSSGGFLVASYDTKSRAPLLVGIGVALLALAGLAYHYSDVIKEKIFGKKPAATAPAILPAEPKPELKLPEVPTIHAPVPLLEPKLPELKTPAPVNINTKLKDGTGLQMLLPPDTEIPVLKPQSSAAPVKQWEFPEVKNVRSPEFFALHIKRNIAKNLWPEYSKNEDAANLLKWLIGQYGGETSNTLQMDGFTREIGFAAIKGGETKITKKERSELTNGDKIRMQFALLAHTLYGGFLEQSVRDDITKKMSGLFDDISAAGQRQLPPLEALEKTYQAYVQKAAGKFKLDKYEEHAKRHSIAIPEGPVVNRYITPTKIESVQCLPLGKLDSLGVGARKIAA